AVCLVNSDGQPKSQESGVQYRRAQLRIHDTAETELGAQIQIFLQVVGQRAFRADQIERCFRDTDVRIVEFGGGPPSAEGDFELCVLREALLVIDACLAKVSASIG